MLFNYLKIAWRNSLKNKLWSFINISSLALGIAACLLIYLFIQDERSFDAFHFQKDNIYRLDEVQSFPGTNTQKVALSMPGMGPAITEEYPEILAYTRFWGRGRQLGQKNGTEYLIEQCVVVDSTFLEIFDFPIKNGDKNTALDEPNSVVLTERIADQFFSEEDPVGQTLKLRDDDFEVTAVLKNIPENSHLQFDLLISVATFLQDDPSFNEQFGSNYLTTYLLADINADMDNLESRMPDFLLKHMPPDPGSTSDVNDYYKIFFQPLEDVHLASTDIEHDYHNYRKFNGDYLSLFSFVGLFILLIASFNFMNLITARASHRWNEVGVRKTVGAEKWQVLTQFTLESAFMGLISFTIGFLLALACTPLINHLLDRELTMTFFFVQPIILVLALLITLVLSILAGLYPSYYLSSFKIVSMLRGGGEKYRKSIFRSSLVILQFGIAIGMIICTFIVIKQLYFIQNKDIGFNKDHIVLVDMNQQANEVFETLKNELNGSPLIKGVTASGQRLGNNFHQWGFKLRTDSIQGLTPSNVNVDYDYLTVYDIYLKAGRNFSVERPLDKDYAFIINESLAKEIGIDDPIGLEAGHSWYPDDTLGTIIGVAEDFNFNSLHYKINTLAMVVHPDWGYDEMSIKIDGNQIEAAIAEIENKWNTLVPTWPFQYSFLDDHFDQLYRSDKQMESVFTIMAILAILIACLGLFGLTAISTEKRIKEIGIRKVLGASLWNIQVELSKNYALLVLLAFSLVSVPTYLLMQNWLQNFAERIVIQPFYFAGGFLIAFVIALLTISYHTMNAATSNPVHALRSN